MEEGIISRGEQHYYTCARSPTSVARLFVASEEEGEWKGKGQITAGDEEPKIQQHTPKSSPFSAYAESLPASQSSTLVDSPKVTTGPLSNRVSTFACSQSLR
jgi:hypothetical protein